jgi:predicted ArsR family transcriptional regulator
MKVSQEEYDLLTELAEQYDYPDLDPDKHVTANMLADKLGVSHRAAWGRLEKSYKSGDLERERVRLPNGNRAWGYFRAN